MDWAMLSTTNVSMMVTVQVSAPWCCFDDDTWWTQIKTSKTVSVADKHEAWKSYPVLLEKRNTSKVGERKLWAETNAYKPQIYKLTNQRDGKICKKHG